jgi:hypothetical protein
VPALGRAAGSSGAGHIQQLQRLGSVERDQTGQRVSAGHELAQLADVAGGRRWSVGASSSRTGRVLARISPSVSA